MQADLSFGLGVGGDAVGDVDANDIYVAAVRLAFPVHRGIRADYSLIAGGGAIFVRPPEGSTATLADLGAGAKFRVFFTPNVAVGATLGIAAFIRGENSNLGVGARPLGGASVVYFFR